MSFDTLGLLAELLKAITEKGYKKPTPIQSKAIPEVLKGSDIMGGAQTGTGKTAGFTLPLLQLLSKYGKDKGKRPIRALILTPTRELAAQVGESVKTYGKYLPLKSAIIFGGVKISPQVKILSQGVDILIATPGRLLDHVNQGNIDLSQVEILVLDEADRMLDMGFVHDVKKVIKLVPSKRQNLLFSATFSDEIKRLADSLLRSPVMIEVARRNASAEHVQQLIHPVDRVCKSELLSHLIKTHNWKQVLVFTRTKHGANRLAEKLNKDEINASAIHGNKSQGARTKALADFKSGRVRILVATDIAARGLDIDQLPHVVNFELPSVPEDYIHRIGRTVRAGTKGEAVSLVCIDEERLLRDIERLIKRGLPKEEISGFEVNPSIKAEPIQKQRGSRPPMKNFSDRRNSKRPGKPHRGQEGDRRSSTQKVRRRSK